MHYLCILIVALAAAGCTGEAILPLKGLNNKIEIYQLKSYSQKIDTSFAIRTVVLSDLVLEDNPLVTDNEIRSYTQSAYTFELSKNLNPIIKDFGPDKAFVVTVDKEVIYFGMFRPAYLNSLLFSVPYIEPILTDNNLHINYATMGTTGTPQPIDKRNDLKLINALKATNRLK